MRIRRYEPYEEPQPRRPWTREELLEAVRCVRAMAEDEGAGRDPKRLERQAALAEELGRSIVSVRPRLGNIASVLRQANLPAPVCLPDMPRVGRRTATAILDTWHELDAEEDMAACGQVQARRPWSEEELETALEACRRMVRQEEALGHALDADEAGDIASETACQTGRRWSETRAVMAAVAGVMAGTVEDGQQAQGPECLRDIAPAVLDATETVALDRLQRRGEKKEG